MNEFEAKKQARIDRYRERAAKARKESGDLFTQGSEMLSVIPMGQPILIGHHSEKRHRNYLKKIDGKFNRASEAGEKADYYAEKAHAAENNRAIFSDDPQAAIRLKIKIEKAEEAQESYKAANKIIRSKSLTFEEKIEQLQAMNLSRGSAEKFLTEKDFAGRLGFPPYVLTNNNANIRRMKERLVKLEANAGQETTTKEVKGIEIVENIEENRIQLIFPGKPAEDIRKLLKSSGFRWSPRNTAWQRHLNSAGKWAAARVIEKINTEQPNETI